MDRIEHRDRILWPLISQGELSMKQIYLENVNLEHLLNWIKRFWELRYGTVYSVKKLKKDDPKSKIKVLSTSSFNSYGIIPTLEVEGECLLYNVDPIESPLIKLEFYVWSDTKIRMDIVSCVTPLKSELEKMQTDFWFKKSIVHTEEVETPAARLKEELKLWNHIPDIGEDKKIVELYCNEYLVKDIAREVHMSELRVYKRLADLRKIYPIPKRKKSQDKQV